MNIIESLKNKQLLGMFLDNQQSWASWFTFLKAFFCLEPDKHDLKLFKKCTGRKWPKAESKEAWIICGVRAGKSFIIALIATYLAVFRKYKLSPGEKGYVIVVAPTKRQASIIKRYLSSFFNDNPFFNPYCVRETSDEIELNNNIKHSHTIIIRLIYSTEL